MAVIASFEIWDHWPPLRDPQRYLAMGDKNAYFRRENTRHVPTTDGIPDFYLSTVRMFRAAFPKGLPIDSPDYTAVCVFLDYEEYGHRQIAQMLDFAFDLGYVDVFNAVGFIQDDDFRRREITRIEEQLRPHGLEVKTNMVARPQPDNHPLHRRGGQRSN